MKRLFSFFRDEPVYVQTKAWAAAQGFMVEPRCTEAGRTFYPVWWWDRQRGRGRAEVADLSDLPRLIHDLKENGQAPQPGEFYVCWSVLQPDEWRSASWINVTVWEGAPPPFEWSMGRIIDGFDPTPYASPQEAVDTVAFLPLELGVPLRAYAMVRYITDELDCIPTPAYNREEIEQAILGVMRARVYERVGRYRDDVEYVMYHLPGISVPWRQGSQIVEQMIAEGRLVRGWQYERFWWKRWLLRWRNRGRVCFAEAGWKCQWVPCENCGGSGKCPICQGSGWRSDKDECGNPLPCFVCHGYRARYVQAKPKKTCPGSGRCRRCEGKSKVGGLCQQIGETAQSARADPTRQQPYRVTGE